MYVITDRFIVKHQRICRMDSEATKKDDVQHIELSSVSNQVDKNMPMVICSHSKYYKPADLD